MTGRKDIYILVLCIKIVFPSEYLINAKGMMVALWLVHCTSEQSLGSLRGRTFSAHPQNWSMY